MDPRVRDELTDSVVENMKSFKCIECGREYMSNSSLLLHCRRKHKVSCVDGPYNVIVCCPICEGNFYSRPTFEGHLLEKHNVTINRLTLSFPSEKDFLVWKKDEEKKSSSHFVKHRGCKTKGDTKVSYFYCHRSGIFQKRGFTDKNLKFMGSNKINANCPARMRVVHTPLETTVYYTETHVGHTCDIERLPVLLHAHKVKEKSEEVGIDEVRIKEEPGTEVGENNQSVEVNSSNENPETEIIRIKKEPGTEICESILRRKEIRIKEKPRTEIGKRSLSVKVNGPNNIRKLNQPRISTSDDEDDPAIKCLECEKRYKTVSGLLLHTRRAHGDGSVDSSTGVEVRCPICLEASCSKEVFEGHLLDKHNINLKRQTLIFASRKDFLTWKGCIEKESSSCYVKQYFGRKRLIDMKVSYYYCHRNGICEARGTADKNASNHDFAKINGCCPAMLKVIETRTELKVEYVETHVGHTCDIVRLPQHKRRRRVIDTSVVLRSEAEKVDNDKRDQCDADRVSSNQEHSEMYCSESHANMNENNTTFTCLECDEEFDVMSNLLVHSKRKHTSSITSPHCVICPVCKNAFYSKKTFEKHLFENHNIKMKKTSLCFSTEEEFLVWKEQQEKKSSFRFVKHKSNKAENNTKTYYYYCDRSKSFEKPYVTDVNMKAMESGKGSGSCPARIKVVHTPMDLKVKYVETHVGHASDAK